VIYVIYLTDWQLSVQKEYKLTEHVEKKRRAIVIIEDDVEAVIEIANALAFHGIAEQGITTFWAGYGAEVVTGLYDRINHDGFEIVTIIMDHHYSISDSRGTNEVAVEKLRGMGYTGPIIASSLSEDGNDILKIYGTSISIHQRLPKNREYPNKSYAVDIFFSYLETGKLE